MSLESIESELTIADKEKWEARWGCWALDGWSVWIFKVELLKNLDFEILFSLLGFHECHNLKLNPKDSEITVKWQIVTNEMFIFKHSIEAQRENWKCITPNTCPLIRTITEISSIGKIVKLDNRISKKMLHKNSQIYYLLESKTKWHKWMNYSKVPKSRDP